MAPSRPHPELPRGVALVGLGLAALLVLGVLALAVLGPDTTSDPAPAPEDRTGPLAVSPVPAPDAEGRDCAALLAALPDSLTIGGTPVPRRELRAPAPPATTAWGDAGHDPVTLRCGIETPAELTPTSQLRDVSGVGWLALPGDGVTSYIVADRPVRIALTVPTDAGTGPLQDLSAVVERVLPRRPVFD